MRRAPTRDRTADLARIIRHVLKAEAASPLDRAIRAAVAAETGYVADVDGRAGALARRLNALLGSREAAALGDAQGETVRE
jgi:hypothetical protein